jgi:CheY-like chemotaxis protein
MTGPALMRSRPRHILIVEDNADCRETLHRLLELLGHHVDIARDGVEAVDVAHERRPEVAIVDVGLPRLDGYQVARRLRAEFGAGIFLIAHSGYNLPRDRERGLEAGFDLYLGKPLDLAELKFWLATAAPAGCYAPPVP